MSRPTVVAPVQSSSDVDFHSIFRFLDDYAHHFAHRHHGVEHFVPRFDLEEHEDSYEVYGELPGARSEDIIVEAHDERSLQISGIINRHIVKAPESSNNGESSNLPAGNASGDLFVKVQHHETPKTEKVASPWPEMYEEVLNPNGAALPIRANNQTNTAATQEPKHFQTPLCRSEKHGEVPLTRSKSGFEKFEDIVSSLSASGDKEKAPAKETTVEPTKVRNLISERQYGDFHRTITFPKPIKPDDVTARLENGILHITVPRAPVPEVKKVHIHAPPQYGGFVF